MGKTIITATQALNYLVEGNQRFANGLRSVETILTQSKMKELAEKGQSPFAIVLTCSDSRVPAEIVFDRGLGDLFVIRVAGNVVAPSLLASIEFAALNFGTPLCIVMGHSHCGAIRTTIDAELKGDPKGISENLKSLMKKVRPAVRHTLKNIEAGASHEEVMTYATLCNVRHSVRSIIRKSPTIAGLVETGDFILAGAVYDIHTGKVNFDLPKSLSVIGQSKRQNKAEAV